MYLTFGLFLSVLIFLKNYVILSTIKIVGYLWEENLLWKMGY